MTDLQINAEIVNAWEDVSKAGNNMMVLEWSVEDVGSVRQYLLNRIPVSADLLRKLLKTAGRSYAGPGSLVGCQAHVDVDMSGDWPSVVEVKIP